jgi:hypothetical protein
MIVSLIAAAAALSAPTEADRRMADLQLIYAQSCEVRAYATFDRMCTDLKRQMREAEKAYRKEAQARPKAKPALALTAPPAQSPPTRD